MAHSRAAAKSAPNKGVNRSAASEFLIVPSVLGATPGYAKRWADSMRGREALVTFRQLSTRDAEAITRWRYADQHAAAAAR